MRSSSLSEHALRLAMHEVLDGASMEAAAQRHGIPLIDLRAALERLGRTDAPSIGGKPVRSSDRRKLSLEQERAIHEIIRNGLPDAIGGQEPLWSREAVRWLVQRETGNLLPERTLSTYLERWGFAPEKPMRTMAARQPLRMRAWLKQDYPVIAMLAREGSGRVAWWGAAPLLARQQGKQPPGSGPAFTTSELWEPGRFGIAFITTNRGHIQWRVHEGPPSTELAIDLLHRAVASDARKLFLIVPSDPVFAAPRFISWALSRKDDFSFHIFRTD